NHNKHAKQTIRRVPLVPQKSATVLKTAKQTTLRPRPPEVPIMLWWDSVYTSVDDFRQCGQITCRMFIFYGSHFKPYGLPFPRKQNHLWALLHEESPRNAYILSHEPTLTYFNFTSSYNQRSDYPIATQWLQCPDWLQDKEFLLPLVDKNRLRKSGLAPILLRFENSMAPLDEREFFQFAARYKFTLAMENYVCEDYVTEKLWRPFQYVKLLDKNNILYNDYLRFKEQPTSNTKLKKLLKDRDWVPDYCKRKHRSPFQRLKQTQKQEGLTHSSLFIGFECFLCNQIHKIEKQVYSDEIGMQFDSHVATSDQYYCPSPRMFDENVSTMRNGHQNGRLGNTRRWPSKNFMMLKQLHLKESSLT
ncbi:FUT10-like protein, partial [Mya arenaria]